MIDYTSSRKFKQLAKWIERSDGTPYGCVEINSPQYVSHFIRQLQETTGRRVVEVDFAPSSRKNNKENTDLIVPYHHYLTIQSFEKRFGEETVFVITGLDRNTDRDEKAVRDAIAEINMNRENYVRHPGIVILVFPRWFMDRIFRFAADFVSQMAFHFDLTDIQDEAYRTNLPETPTWGKNELPVLQMKDTYAERMQDEGLPLLERLDAAQKFVGVCSYYYQTDSDAKELVHYARGLAEQTELKSEKRAKKVANILGSLGNYAKVQAQYQQALEDAQKALTLDLKYCGDSSLEAATDYNIIAGIYDDMGDYDKALEYDKKTLSISEKVLGFDHPDTASSYNNIANVYYHKGDYDKALEYYKKDLSISEKVFDFDHPETATSYNNIANVYDNKGDYDKALEYYKKALAICEKVLGFDHPYTATSYNNIALVYAHKGDYDRALEYYKKALSIREKVLDFDHPDTALSYYNISFTYTNMGNKSLALEYLLKAYQIWLRRLGSEHQDTKDALEELEYTYSNTPHVTEETFDRWLERQISEHPL